ncbi:uncharacterized protein LOC105764738 [Gossypium raimondii]|uniref:Uncharacterized protein n=1 Tax=Gossypium raimondii TaxID=29730 RepID=A0A0D2PXM3_GOSRA|nr:uncharacterized protein LOC105764738 [Gossypium raimondii]KJB50892.1 hypothetical protein B456_008G200700 [Gossypium raimondii]
MAMASLPSSPPAPSPPSISASHSESSVTLATALLPPQAQVVATAENGTLNVDDQKPQIANHFAVLDNPENIEKYKKFEADYAGRLMAKYFSKNNFYGGNVFDEKTTIDGETILSSRWPCTRSFADPMNAFKDLNNGGSNAEALK